MEQEGINHNELQTLMERIKESHAGAIWPKNRWWRIVETASMALLPLWLLYGKIVESQNGLERSIYLIMGITYAVFLIMGDYRLAKRNKQVAQAESAGELLATIARENCEMRIGLGILVAVMASGILALLLIHHEVIWAIIVAVVMAMLEAVLIMAKPRQGKDIKRLQELSKIHTDEKTAKRCSFSA